MLEDRFRELCEEEAKKNDVIWTRYEADRKEIRFTMLRRVIRLEYAIRKSLVLTTKNVLFCRIYPNKNNEKYYFLPEIFSELGTDEFRATFFSMIEDEARLEACFNALAAVLNDHIKEIENSVDEGLLPLERTLDPEDSLERKLMFTDISGYSRDDFVLLSYTTANPYKALLLGKNDKAIALYEKKSRKKKIFDYQKRLMEKLKNSGGEFSPMPNEANAVKAFAAIEKKARLLYFTAPFIPFVITAILLIIVHFTVSKLFGVGCIAVYTAPWYFPLVLAGIPALFGAIALRRKTARLLMPKSSAAINKLDSLQNDKATNVLASVLFGVTITVAAALVFVIDFAGLRVYEDRLDGPRERNLLAREEYRYSDIDALVHVKARYNDSGERIERGSYLLIMKDGRKLDLDGSADEDFTEETLLPLLKCYGLEPFELDSERDLEK